MKIAFISGSMNIGGSEIQLLRFIQNRPLDIEVHLFVLSGGPLYDEYLGTDTDIHIMKQKSVLHLPGENIYKFTKWLTAGLKSVKPDFVQSQLPVTNLVASHVCKRLRLPLILNERGMGVTRPFWERIFRKEAYRSAQRITCNSIIISDRLIEIDKVKRSKIRVINNIIEAHPQNARDKVRKSLHISEDTFMVTCVASLKSVKGIHDLIQGYAGFSRISQGETILVLVGSGPLLAQLVKLAKKLEIPNKVLFLGTRKDVSDILAASDLYVSPSLSEGTSNSILEAMSLRLPVVATEVGGTKAVVSHKKTGYLVESSNPKGITTALSELYFNPELRKNLSCSAAIYVTENYSAEKVMKDWVCLYNEVIHHV